MIDLLNRLWRLSCRREASAFRRALQDPQRAHLKRLAGCWKSWGRVTGETVGDCHRGYRSTGFASKCR